MNESTEDHGHGSSQPFDKAINNQPIIASKDSTLESTPPLSKSTDPSGHSTRKEAPQVRKRGVPSSTPTNEKSSGPKLTADTATSQPRGRGVGRPKLHASNSYSGPTSSTSSTKPYPTPNVNANRPVNEIIPKVWIIANFAVPVAQQIAAEALKKGDRVVLGCGSGGSLGQETTKKAETLRLQAPDKCLVVELDIR